MKVIRPIDLNSDGGFTRASTGTYFNVNAVLNTAAINEPRFNFNSLTRDFEGLLIEPRRTNLLTYSETLWDTAQWAVGSTLGSYYTVTRSADVVDPYGGSNNSAKFVAANPTSSLFLRKNSSFALGTYSSSIMLFVPNQVGVDNYSLSVRFGGTEVSADTEGISVFNRWVRIEIPAVTTADARNNIEFNIKVNSSAPPIGFTFYATAVQLEVGTKSTSYIPTTTSTATREADVISGIGVIWTDLTNAHADYDAGTSYSTGAKVSYNKRYYESLQDTNLGNRPDTSPTFWLDIGPDNQHAAVDGSVSTASSRLEEFTLVLKPGISYDSFALINVEAEVIRVAITDPNDGVIYSKTFGLSGIEVYDWYQYFFYDPTIKRTQIVDSNIPPYSNSVVTIKLQTSASSLAELGLVSIGNLSTIGLTRYGVNSGIIDYSVKETDEFGNTTFVERAFSKRINADVYVNNFELNRVQRLLFDLRANPSVWIASDDPTFEEALIVYGFYRDFSTQIAYPRHSICNIEIEGLA